MQNGANLLRSLIEQRSLPLFVYIILHCVSMIVLLFITRHVASRDWETVKTVVPGNSSSKPDQLGSEGKGAEQPLNV